jgi:hypothetical protein
VVRDNDGILFGEAQDWGRWRYQYVVLNDLLPRILQAEDFVKYALGH